MTTNIIPELDAEPTIKDGARCFRIPLTGRDGVGRFAVVDPVGLHRLRESGARALYLVSDGAGREYVTFVRRPRGRVVTAARMIADAPSGHCVKYLNGDRLDLRGSNLRTKTGFAPGEAHAAATAEARRVEAKVSRLVDHRSASPSPVKFSTFAETAAYG